MSDAPVPFADAAALRSRVRALAPQLRADLESLARIPSVSLESFEGFDPAALERSAQSVADLLLAEGLHVQILREGGMPAVLGHVEGPPGAPTVTLYAHHDVQPPGDPGQWHSDPWVPTERAGRLYGRGVADDKAGIVAHLAALRAHAGALPVSVTVFVEGEEEVGSESLPAMLDRHGDKLRGDAIVLADSTNWDVGEPALTTTLRGLVRAVVTVRTLDHAVHSGLFGGPVPDALTALVRLLASLHDDAGDVAVAGLAHATAADLDFPEERLRRESGLLDEVSLIGSGSLLSRLWTRPALTTIGLNAPRVQDASNTLVPEASAKVSLRIAPGEDPQAAYAALERHLHEHAPWGAQVSVQFADGARGFDAPAVGPYFDAVRAAFGDAWGVAPVDVGVGGSIPFVAAFADRFPEAAILVTGVEDPDSRAHGVDESLHLGEWERACVAEAILLARLGALRR